MESSALRKAVLILGLVILAPVLLVSVVALASGEWKPVGQTETGAEVSVSSVRSLPNHQRIALVRVHYKQPAQLPQGGPFAEMRARVRFDCSNGTATPSAEWFYTRDGRGHYAVSKKANQDSQFGMAPEGNFAELISKSVCESSN
ncbi:MAG: surface-adhesin E family protein [Candidatus Sulfotelmatobacter sp.]